MLLSMPNLPSVDTNGYGDTGGTYLDDGIGEELEVGKLAAHRMEKRRTREGTMTKKIA